MDATRRSANRCQKTEKSASFDYRFYVRPSAARGIEYGIELILGNFTMCPITLRLEEGGRVFP